MDIALHPLDAKPILNYLGYRGKASDDTILTAIDEAFSELLQVAKPKAIWKEVTFERRDERLYLSPAFPLIGESIASHLADCHKGYLLCATLGIGVDQWIRQLQIREMTKAVVVDAMCSVAIEQVLDSAMAQYATSLTESLYSTDRFAPGYGDLPLETTKLFLNLLNAQRAIGLTTTSHGLMIPRKSVVALVGLADRPQRQFDDPCSRCDANGDCDYSRKDCHD